MDPTDENTRDLLPLHDCNRSYLVCRPEGETLRVSPVPPVDQHLLTVKTTGTLGADGVLNATSEFSFEGVNDDNYRNLFAQTRPEERRRFFEGRLKESIPGLKLTSLTITPENILDTSVPLHAELKYTATGLSANGDGKSVVGLPWIANDLGVANRILLGSVGLEKRKYPLDTQLTCGVREEMSLKLAGGFAAPLATPKLDSVNDPGVSYNENVVVTNDSLVCTRDFLLKTVEYSPEQYLQLKQTLKDREENRRKDLILGLKSNTAEVMPNATASAEPPADSNAKILDSKKTLTVQDAHTAIYRVKYSKLILTYDGKRRESEVKIPFNPACEDAKIISAVVISKAGTRQEISPDEINVMDQDWNAGAKRYTGGKVLVASLPGVEIGSTIQVEYEVAMRDKPFLAGFEPFQFPDALDAKSFELTAPEGLKIHKLVSGAKGIVTERNRTADGKQTFGWGATNVAALPAEQDLPPAWNYDPGVEYFAGNIGDYWQALDTAMLLHAKNSTNAAALARQLTASAKTKPDAARAIRDYIAQNIREAGPSFTDLPLHELSDADVTLADGYGDDADRAILFHAMLAAAGFQPEFVMASGLPPVDGINDVVKSFPLPDYFQTPLVRIRIGGDDYYLNDGNQYLATRHHRLRQQTRHRAGGPKAGNHPRRQKLRQQNGNRLRRVACERWQGADQGFDALLRRGIQPAASIFRRTAAGGAEPLFSGGRVQRGAGRAGRWRIDDEVRQLSRCGGIHRGTGRLWNSRRKLSLFRPAVRALIFQRCGRPALVAAVHAGRQGAAHPR